MKVKDISKTLGGLIDQANAAASGGGGSGGFNGNGFGGNSPTIYGTPEDSIPAELQDEPIFDIDYKSEQEACIDKARRSIMIIVKEVVPELMQQSELILDKVEQDAEQLGNLYYQYVKKETYHQGLMNLIARGDHSAKSFDICEKISRSLEDLGNKITDLQNQLRKYYIDTYLDLQHKDTEDEINSAKERGTPTAIASNGYSNTQTSSSPIPKLENRMVGTDTVTKSLSEAKKQRLKAIAEAKANAETTI